MMRYRKFQIILILFFLSCSSRTDSFYSYYRQDDLYRLPLIPPYQMTNLAGFDDQPEKSYPWQLHFVHGGDKSVYGFNKASLSAEPRVRPTHINVTNGIIYGYNKRGEFESEIGVVIIPEEKIEKIFKNDELGWRKFLQQKGVKNIKLIPAWQIFSEFKRSYVLPWYNPQKNIYPNNTKS